MKMKGLLVRLLGMVIGLSLFYSCDKTDDDKTGFVSFGANYNVINCITTVSIYVDNKKIGALTNSTDTIITCGEESNLTKELSIGEHSYKIEIRPLGGTGCSNDINGTFVISENECEKIFIDYFKLSW